MSAAMVSGMNAHHLLARAFHEDPFIKWAEPNASRRPQTMAHVFAGRLEPVVDVAWPLERAADAHARLEAGEAFGKVVLVP